MLLLDSVFINNSGGKILLDYLVKELENNIKDVFYLFDKRCENSFSEIPGNRKLFVKGSLISRHKFYKGNSDKFSKVLCFGNIPPTLKLEIPVFTYFHNVSLFYQPNIYSLKEKSLKKLKGKFIDFITGNTDFFLVQTDEVKKLLNSNVKSSFDKCLIFPFFDVKTKTYTERKGSRSGFVFISNGNSHKNHLNLLKAWEILGKRGLFPELHLTVTKNYSQLVEKINEAISNGLQIYNHGYTNPYNLYYRCKYIVYPSLCESFGLGLIEAVESGCDVIAADLPYVYEVVKPTATFNPYNSLSIADSVEGVISNSKSKKTELVVENQIQNLLELLKP